MHAAYDCVPILEKFPLHIESIATYDDRVLVGTRQGQLLLYRVRILSSGSSSCDIQLLRSNKNFSRRPISQIDTIPEHQTLISLSDGNVTLHDLSSFNFNLFSTLSKCKGASLFQLNIQRRTSLTGEPSVTVRLCVAVRRRLQLFYWKNREFHQLASDVSVPDVPRALAWGRNALCISLKNDYCLVKSNGERRELFPTGKAGEPSIASLAEGQLTLLRDQQSIFVDFDEGITQQSTVTWSKLPISVLYDPPYLIALCKDQLEIRTREPRLHIQTLEWQCPRFMTCLSRGQIIVASSSHLWLLRGVPVEAQISDLIASKNFQLALCLSEISDTEEGERERQQQHIRNLHAFDMFTKKQFKQAMEVFLKLKTDPSHVIGLFPELLPHQYWSQLKYPDTLPTLTGRDLENGLIALADFLTQVRYSLLKEVSSGKVDSDDASSSVSMMGGSDRATQHSRQQLLQIVDTTLLKCYIKTNSALVSSLLHLKGNNCHLGESEAALRREHKYTELVLLYQTRQMHTKALQMLYKFSRQADGPLSGNRHIIAYLQRLGSDHMELILEYARPLLTTSPDQALEIFTDDCHEIEHLPRQPVCEFLRSTAPQLLLAYLEHVVHVWNDTTLSFHNDLIVEYRCRVQSELRQQQQQKGDKSGDGEGSRSETRTKLLRFLEESRHYIPEQVLVQFPHDDLYEERAVLLGRLGRHDQALAIYLHVLGDRERALAYCQQHYNALQPEHSSIYLSLYTQLVSPVAPRLLGVLAPCFPQQHQPQQQPAAGNQSNSESTTTGNTTTPHADIPAAIALLQKHGDKIDFVRALSLLPDNQPLRCHSQPELSEIDQKTSATLVRFIRSAVRRVEAQRRVAQLRNALQVRHSLAARAERLAYQSNQICVDDSSQCASCKKRFAGQSVLVRISSGELLHYACHENLTKLNRSLFEND